MKSHARVVVIGGGSLGVNLLYHLASEGWSDIALVEKGELTSGSTWHAAGLCGNFIGNMTVSQIHNYTIRLYNEILPQETGQASSFHQTGSIRVGYSKVEEEWFRNLESRAKNVGFEFNLITREEAAGLNPLMNFDKARVIVSTPAMATSTPPRWSCRYPNWRVEKVLKSTALRGSPKSMPCPPASGRW